MTHYRIRQNQGTEFYWIEKAYWKIGNFYFGKLPVGNSITLKTGHKKTIPHQFVTSELAMEHIIKLQDKSRKYQQSKSYVGPWV